MTLSSTSRHSRIRNELNEICIEITNNKCLIKKRKILQRSMCLSFEESTRDASSCLSCAKKRCFRTRSLIEWIDELIRKSDEMFTQINTTYANPQEHKWKSWSGFENLFKAPQHVHIVPHWNLFLFWRIDTRLEINDKTLSTIKQESVLLIIVG